MTSSLILCKRWQFLDWIEMCNEKWILYDNWQWPTQWLDREEASKHFPKPKCHQKKDMVTVQWSAARLIHYSFLNPGKTIISEKHAQQINEMHWKLQHLQLVLVKRKCPILHENTQPDITQPTHQMLNELGHEVLPHLPYSPDLSPTDDHFFKYLDNFCKKNASTTSQMQKMLSMSLSNPEAWIFTQQE